MTEVLYSPTSERFLQDTKEMARGKITTRNATIDDIPTLVDVDMRSFATVYSGYNQSEEELRAELTEKFQHRYETVGSRWIKVAEKNGNIVGFMMSCPTDKQPDNFTSWEDATDNGMLTNTYNPKGKNLYIVSLSMLPQGSAELGQNMLYGNLLVDFLKEDFDLAYFESRVPNFRTWVKKQCRINAIDFSELGDEDLDVFAKEYFHLTKTDKEGKIVPYDKLLEIYHNAGCRFVDIYRDAYNDIPSMNYGVLGIFDNPFKKVPMGETLRSSTAIRSVAAFAVQQAAKSNYLMGKLF